MNNTATQLPGYITSATPNPAANRAPWYKNTAPTYAGIFLWFVFWQDAVTSGTLGGGLAQGWVWSLVSLILAALVCHFLFYLVPGLLGQKTGLPLYIVGTSTFGAQGGFIMPGFLMGVLQFGWLGVNVYFSSLAIHDMIPSVPAQVIMVAWGVLAAIVGLKGIQYVAKVATYLPLIPLAILIILLVKTMGSVSGFNPKELIDLHKAIAPDAPPALDKLGVLALAMTFVVGFFATAGAAGVDFGTNSRDAKDVQNGGLAGIALAIILTAGLSAVIVAGAYGNAEIKARIQAGAAKSVAAAVADKTAEGVKAGKPLSADELKGFTNEKASQALLRSPNLISAIMEKGGAAAPATNAVATLTAAKDKVVEKTPGEKAAALMMFLLALAAFPPACFSSFIAANSFKTTLPKVNPFISVGIGAAISIALAVTGLAGKVIPVFVIIGASFGPICGAMMVDYLINGKQWTGPRAGFNPAGWISWALGFVVGILPNVGVAVPAAPVAAFIVGAVVYFICAKAGMQSAVVPLPAAQNQAK